MRKGTQSACDLVYWHWTYLLDKAQLLVKCFALLDIHTVNSQEHHRIWTDANNGAHGKARRRDHVDETVRIQDITTSLNHLRNSVSGHSDWNDTHDWLGIGNNAEERRCKFQISNIPWRKAILSPGAFSPGLYRIEVASPSYRMWIEACPPFIPNDETGTSKSLGALSCSGPNPSHYIFESTRSEEEEMRWMIYRSNEAEPGVTYRVFDWTFDSFP